ncbi:hypothetical protein CBF23_010315 [Marinomonas agarivorans]|nr:hypothetical protein CBF23_010315 [Marinomonas agarivorans]
MDMLLAILGLVGAFIGVWATYWTYVNGKRLELFQTYIDKFNDIITPEDMPWWTKSMSNEPLDSENIQDYEMKMLRYLNLVWEEHFLYTEGMISKKLWRLWEPNICFALKTDFCRQVFDKYETSFGPEFCQWVKTSRQ